MCKKKKIKIFLNREFISYFRVGDEGDFKIVLFFLFQKKKNLFLQKALIKYIYYVIHSHFTPQAVRTQAPPAAKILLSAVLEKYLALTTTGYYGNLPFPSTLKYPAFPTSITGTFS